MMGTSAFHLLLFLVGVCNGSYAEPIDIVDARKIAFKEVTIDQIYDGPAPPMDFAMETTIMRLDRTKTLSVSVLGAGPQAAAAAIVGEQMNGPSMVNILAEEQLLNVHITESSSMFANYICHTADGDAYSITASPFVQFVTGPKMSDVVVGTDLVFKQDSNSTPTNVWVVDEYGKSALQCSMQTVDWPILVTNHFRSIWMVSAFVEQPDENSATCDYYRKVQVLDGFLMYPASFSFNPLTGTHMLLDFTTNVIFWEMTNMGGSIFDYVDYSSAACQDDGAKDIVLDTAHFLSTPSDSVVTSQFADNFLNTSRYHQETIELMTMTMEAMVLGDVSDIFQSSRRWMSVASPITPKDAIIELADQLKSQFQRARETFELHDCAFEAIVAASQTQRFMFASFLRLKIVMGDTCQGKICSQKCDSTPTSSSSSGPDLENEISASRGLYDWPWGTAIAVVLGTAIFVVAFGGGAN